MAMTEATPDEWAALVREHDEHAQPQDDAYKIQFNEFWADLATIRDDVTAGQASRIYKMWCAHDNEKRPQMPDKVFWAILYKLPNVVKPYGRGQFAKIWQTSEKP